MILWTKWCWKCFYDQNSTRPFQFSPGAARVHYKEHLYTSCVSFCNEVIYRSSSIYYFFLSASRSFVSSYAPSALHFFARVKSSNGFTFPTLFISHPSMIQFFQRSSSSFRYFNFSYLHHYLLMSTCFFHPANLQYTLHFYFHSSQDPTVSHTKAQLKSASEHHIHSSSNDKLNIL